MQHTITKEQLVTYRGVDDQAPRVSNVVRNVFEGRACVSLSRSCVEISDPYGLDDRQTVCYYGDSEVVWDAIVDLMGSVHREVNRARERGDLGDNVSARAHLGLLQRVAGELGLVYGQGD